MGQPGPLLPGKPNRARYLAPQHLVLSPELLDLAAEVILTIPNQDAEQAEKWAAGHQRLYATYIDDGRSHPILAPLSGRLIPGRPLGALSPLTGKAAVL